MREIFKYGSVGGAPGNRCFYPEQPTGLKPRFFKWCSLSTLISYSKSVAMPRPAGEARRWAARDIKRRYKWTKIRVCGDRLRS